MADNGWRIIDGKLTNINFVGLLDKGMKRPYPASLWRTDPAVNNGKPFTGLMVGLEYIYEFDMISAQLNCGELLLPIAATISTDI